MQIKFSKYHGTGNDFIIIDSCDVDYSELAKKICNRHIGIGADGLIIVGKSPLTMTYYNQDGSIGTMCGNGLRCFSKYVVDSRFVEEGEFDVRVKNKVYKVRVCNGVIETEYKDISFSPLIMDIDTTKEKFINEKVIKSFCYAIYTGTTHIVVFVDNVNVEARYAKSLHEAKVFRSKTNVNFVRVIDRKTIEVNTYERGVGYTLSCGTGSVASFKISNMLGYVDDEIKIHYKYGTISLKNKEDYIVLLGPAVKIGAGIFEF